MDAFVKSTKPASRTNSKSMSIRPHPYKSHADQIKEKCCVPRPVGNIYTSSSTGHQVSQAPGKAVSYFHSRNTKLAQQFKRDSSAPRTEATNRQSELFRNCCVYVNGYMGSTISDLELKKRLVQHGARVVANFGRKGVTHVILGPNGLASGKIQKEMLAKQMGVKYVTVDWVLDSLREGKRMMEAKYAIIRHEKQASVYEILADKSCQQDDARGVLEGA